MKTLNNRELFTNIILAINEHAGLKTIEFKDNDSSENSRITARITYQFFDTSIKGTFTINANAFVLTNKFDGLTTYSKATFKRIKKLNKRISEIVKNEKYSLNLKEKTNENQR